MTYPEVGPTIIVDKEIGKAVDDLDIDVGACTELLRQHGMDDEAINSLGVNISLETAFSYHGRIVHEGKQGILFRAINGRYYPRSKTIDIYLGSIITEQTDEDRADKIAQDTLIHELGHALHDDSGEMPDTPTLRNMLAVSAIGTAATAGVFNVIGTDPKYWPAAIITGAALLAGQVEIRRHQVAEEEAITQQFTEATNSDDLKIFSVSPKPDATEKLNKLMISTVKRFEYRKRQNTPYNKVVRALTNSVINYVQLLDKNET